MIDIELRRRGRIVLGFLLGAAILFSACSNGSEGVNGDPNLPAGQAIDQQDETPNDFSSDQEDISTDSVASERSPEQENDRRDGESVPVSGAGDTDQDAKNIDFDPGSIEADVDGVSVGFTTDGHPFRGDPAAPVVVKEFSDYQCPFCARFVNDTLPSLASNQIAGGEAVLVFYDFPLVNSHPQAAAAANAARCAGEQGAANYWAMHDALFANPSEWSVQIPEPIFMDYAENLGLGLAAFNNCIEDFRFEEQIQADMEAGSSAGISGTPSFLMNGELLIGAKPTNDFDVAIASLLEGGHITVSEPAPPPEPPPPGVAPTPAALSEEFAGVMGDPGAAVTIVEFTDFQCPYCSRHSLETMPLIIQQMIDTGRVYYILKDYPLDQIHPDARRAAVAARCASDQDSYWEMHDTLFANQGEWAGLGEQASELFVGYASDNGLDADLFAECLDGGRHDDEIEANVQEGRSLGVSGTPHFFVDGYPLNGARPFEHFLAAVSLAEEGRLAEAFTPPPQQTPEPVTVSESDSFSIGDSDAPITIVEFTDYQCPYCSRHFQNTYPQIVEQFVNAGLVRYVFKDFPLTRIHPQAAKASEAARCAQDQNAYLEMHDLLFGRQEEWSGQDPVDVFSGYAGELGLDEDAFDQCLTGGKYESFVASDLQEGIALGVTGTPTFFINGYAVIGAQPYSVFQQAITSLLEEQEG